MAQNVKARSLRIDEPITEKIPYLARTLSEYGPVESENLHAPQYLLASSSRMEQLRNSFYEMRRRWRNCDPAREDCLIRYVFPVVSSSVIVVLIDNISCQIDSGENALAA